MGLSLGFLLNADGSQAENAIKHLQDTTDQAGSKMAGSFREARGSAMLFEEVIGVHLPRELNALIARAPVVGEALEAMLPLAGVLAAIMVIGRLVEAHEKLQKAIYDAGMEAAKSAVKNADQTKSIELTNLKLDDQIAKLEHRPAHNYMAEAILETSKDVDDLLSSYSSDIEKMTKLTESQTGIWIGLWRGVKDAFSGVGQAHGYGTVTKQWDELKQKMLDVQKVEGQLSETDPFDVKATSAAQQNVIDKLKEEKAALTALQVIYRDNKDQLLQLGEQYNSVTSELANLNRTLDESKKKKQIAGFDQMAEDIKANLIPYFGEFIQQQVKSGKFTSAAAEEFAKKWGDAFYKQSQEGAKAANKLKHVWDDIDEEQVKAQNESDKNMVEGQKETAGQIEVVVRGMVETNLANLKQLTEGIEADMDKLKATLTAREAGLTGFTLDVAKVRDERQELQLLTQQMAQLVAERQRLESDKGLLSPADTANVNKYNDAIAVVNKQLQAMGLTFAKAQADVQHVTSEMMKQRGVIPALVTLFQSAASQQNKNTSITKAFTLALQDQTKATKEDAEAAAASFAQMAISHFISRRAMAIIEAIWETAQGLSDLAKPGMQWAAAIHFLSAAEYGLIAGTSGGKGRGGAASGGEENKSKTQGTEGSKGIPGVVGGSGGGGTGPVTHITIMGGMITNTGDMQQLVSALNSGGAGGTLRLNMGGTSSTIPNPSY